MCAGCVTRVWGRDEHWTGLRLDWIRNITNPVGFGLDPDYIVSKIEDQDRI